MASDRDCRDREKAPFGALRPWVGVRALLTFSLMLFMACGTTEMGGPACALDGCLDGLHVILEGDLPAEFTIEVRDEEKEIAITRDCDAVLCAEVFFEDFTPEEVVVEIRSATGTDRATFRPDYEPSMAGCGTVCHFGQIRMTIEE